ncbi:MAG: NADPH-dependent reductase [Caulobacteraceae bacterium]|nr:NADPH-dependent reductase [Caulobacteraceae bacterium]
MTTHLLGLTGSLRRASYSTAILQELQAELGEGIRFDVASPHLPLYNEDTDGAEALEAVQAFRNAIAAADGLVICTPEYNHGIPGVLKNALDWASRPSGKSALKDKPTLIISNSPAFTGGVRAQAQLHETLLAAHAFIVPGRQIVMGGIVDKIRDGRFVDKANLSFALAATHKLAEYCRRVRDGEWGTV